MCVGVKGGGGRWGGGGEMGGGGGGEMRVCGGWKEGGGCVCVCGGGWMAVGEVRVCVWVGGVCMGEGWKEGGWGEKVGWGRCVWGGEGERNGEVCVCVCVWGGGGGGWREERCVCGEGGIVGGREVYGGRRWRGEGRGEGEVCGGRDVGWGGGEVEGGWRGACVSLLSLRQLFFMCYTSFCLSCVQLNLTTLFNVAELV